MENYILNIKERFYLLQIKENKYEIKGDYVVGYADRSNREFYFDIEDFEKVKKYHWIFDSKGNVVSKYDKPRLSMHKLIMGEGIYIHKNNNKSDNRKSNLVPTKNYHNDGKTFLNGYIAIYMPEHERAFDNGCVYEHILVAEKILDRKLKEQECVHHKDKNRTNNSPDNLMIFKTNEDHIAYHGGAELIVDDEGIYSCIRVFEKYIYYYNNRTRYDIDTGIIDVGSMCVRRASQIDKCPVCNINYKFKKYQMCIQCRRENNKNIFHQKKN